MGILDWLRRLVGEVPPEDAVCEFRCHRTSCRLGEWARCEYRLRGGLPEDLERAGPQRETGNGG